jgi:hypothetical protein
MATAACLRCYRYPLCVCSRSNDSAISLRCVLASSTCRAECLRAGSDAGPLTSTPLRSTAHSQTQNRVVTRRMLAFRGAVNSSAAHLDSIIDALWCIADAVDLAVGWWRDLMFNELHGMP